VLAGEPYVLEYQKNVIHQIKSMKGFRYHSIQSIIPGQLVMWSLTRDKNKEVTVESPVT